MNQYAAMPSLHVGWDLLVGMSIVAAASTAALRVVGFALPVLMTLAVIVDGQPLHPGRRGGVSPWS